MTTMMTTQHSPDRLGLPPPLELDLIDAGRVAGRIRGNAVTFLGFADEVEAAHAAWVAHRTLARRLALARGARPVPVDAEPLAIERRDDAEVILAGGPGGRPIATLLRPDADIGGEDGHASFGFGIRVPATAIDAAANEVQVRAMAHQMYRTLRRSGIRWALWRPALGRPTTQRVRDVAGDLPRTAETSGVSRDARSASALVAKTVLAAMAVVLGVASIAAAPPTVIVPLAVALVVGLVATGLVAMGDRMLARPRRARGTPSPRPVIDMVWKAVVAGSVAVLMVALVLPEGPRVVLALLGFAGLMLFRLAAMYGGWAPRYTGIRRAPGTLGRAPRPVPALIHGD